MNDRNAEASKTPNPVDLHVGGRVRMRRKMLGVSQERLAEALGLTFQQVQKYERGANRISASKLYDIARFLSAPIAYFFEGLGDPVAGSVPGADETSEQHVHGFLMTTEGLELAAAFPRIVRPRLRRRILDLVRSLSEDDEEPT